MRLTGSDGSPIAAVWTTRNRSSIQSNLDSIYRSALLLENSRPECHIIQRANNCLLNLSLPLRSASVAHYDTTDVSATPNSSGTCFFSAKIGTGKAMLKISAEEIHFIIY